MDPTQTNQPLIIKNYPLIFWIICAVLILSGAYFVLSSETRILGSILALLGVVITVLVSIETITVDKAKATFILHKRSLLKQSTQEFNTNDIASVELESSNSDNSSVYREVIVLKNGERVPFRNSYSSGLKGKEKRIQQIRDFLGMTGPIPGEDPVNLFNVLSGNLPATLLKSGETNGISWCVENLAMGSVHITRWSTSAVSSGINFIGLFQKPESAAPQSTSKIAGMISGITAMLDTKILALYGLPTDGIPPGNAQTLDTHNPGMQSCYTAITNNPDWASDVFSPRVISPLMAWASQFPCSQGIKSGSAVPMGNLALLYSSQGLYLSSYLNNNTQVDSLIDLGVELANALK